MRNDRYRHFRRALFEGGVAPRHIDRMTRELGDHYQDAWDQAVAAGHPPEEAARQASQQLGDPQLVIGEALSRPELQSWSRRWPWFFFGIAPVFCYAAAVLALGISAIAILDSGLFTSQLDLRPIPEWLTVFSELFRLALLYGLPVLFSLTWVVYGQYRAMHRGWILTACVLVALAASGTSITIEWPMVPGVEGQIGAGWGFSIDRPWIYLTRCTSTVLLAVASFRYFQRGVQSEWE